MPFSPLRLLVLCLLSILLKISSHAQDAPRQIAFLADVHLQDLYGTLQKTKFQGIINPEDGDRVLLRTMNSQLHSTRIFNENYFAFQTALEDIASRGVKLVALPGDYTDDGQPIHVRGLRDILQHFSERYNITFLITTGNHDPAMPFEQHAGKRDFLGTGGRPQPIFSQEGLYVPKDDEHAVAITPDVVKMGYGGISGYLKNFGYMPQENYLFWSTPFSEYQYQDYTFEKADQAAGLNDRTYRIGATVLPDLSYVVEPVKGVWLLALDGDVFVPKEEGGFSGAGTGYTEVLKHKSHLIAWVQEVVEMAKEHKKTLIAFSHFPMVEFNDGATGLLRELSGDDSWQNYRVPTPTVAEAFANAGLQLHFAGHMHLNDTGVFTSTKGKTLVNVQSPSLAAYLPAYKLLTIHSPEKLEVETIPLKKVDGFDRLFPLYQAEHQFLKQSRPKTLWDTTILESKDYLDFTDWHLRELVRLRFLKDDLPKPIRDYLPHYTGKDLLLLIANGNFKDPNTFLNRIKTDRAFRKAKTKKAKSLLNEQQLDINGFSQWDGLDLLTDLYRFRNADKLAFDHIPEERLKHYEFLRGLLAKKATTETLMGKQLQLIFNILWHFQNGAPSDHFMIHLGEGTVTRLD